VDCDVVPPDAALFAHQLFTRLLHVPFIAKFAVFARVTTASETRLRVFCVTDDQLDKTLERHQKYREVARSQHVEVQFAHIRLFVMSRHRHTQLDNRFTAVLHCRRLSLTIVV